jgi:hypothetical protein
VSCLVAQPPPDQGQFRQVPGFGYGAFSVHQNAEIGVLEPAQYAPEPDMFQVYTTQTYYHTDNALLTPNPQEANAWIGDIGVSFVPYSTVHWTPRLTVDGALVRFDNVSPFDFNIQDVAFENSLGLTENNQLSWNFSVAALRAERREALPGEFYKHVEVVNNLNWLLPLDQAGRWVLQVSPGVAWRTAAPSSWNRLDTGALLGVLWFFSHSFAVEPFLEGGYAYFPNDAPGLVGRRDVHVRSGLSLLWQAGRHVSVVASGYWFGNYSSAEAADYQILPCVTLNARIGF